MLFWCLAAVLTAMVTAAVLYPLSRGRMPRADAAAHDEAVYRDQLAELDRDVETGSLGGAEAESARAEIARRLLKAAGERRAGEAAASAPGLRRVASAIVVVLVPALALGAYLRLGSPGLPSEPLSAREAGPGGDPALASLVGKAEAHLSADPGDGRGWDVLAPIYFRTGRVQDAVIAYGNAIRILGPTAQREAGLGEALMMQNGGTVDETAADAFHRALKLEPGNPRARYYLAVQMAEEGKTGDALKAFRDLARTAPADAPWLPAVKREIAALGAAPAEKPATGAAPAKGPTPEQMAAAGNMSAGDRMTMIRGMVSRLDAELSRKPDDLAGWKRLVRSYMVLGEPAKARAALARALEAFPASSDGGKELTALAGDLGVGGKEATQ